MFPLEAFHLQHQDPRNNCWAYNTASGYLQKTYHGWTKINHKTLALQTREKKTNRRFVRGLQTMRISWLPWKSQQIHSFNCFKILRKNESFPLNQNLKFTNFDVTEGTCVMCNKQYVGHMLLQICHLLVNAPRYSRQGKVIGMTANKSPDCGTVQCFITS